MKNTINWNIFDKIIARFRYFQVDKYVSQNSVIADIGCGQEGKFLLRNKSKIKKGYGFDFKIKDKVIDNIEFVNNSKLKKLPLTDKSIDTIFLNAVLEHLNDPKTILKDCLRSLKSNGLIIITTPTPPSKRVLEFMAFKLHIINEAEIREHVRYYSKKDIEDLVMFLNEKYNVTLEKYKKFELGLNSLIVLKKQ